MSLGDTAVPSGVGIPWAVVVVVDIRPVAAAEDTPLVAVAGGGTLQVAVAVGGSQLAVVAAAAAVEVGQTQCYSLAGENYLSFHPYCHCGLFVFKSLRKVKYNLYLNYYTYTNK